MPAAQWIGVASGRAAGAAAVGALIARVVLPSPEMVFPSRAVPVSEWAAGSHRLLEDGLTPRLAAEVLLVLGGAVATAAGASVHGATRRPSSLVLLAVGGAALVAGSGRLLNLGALSLIATLLLFYDRELGVNSARAIGWGAMGSSLAFLAADVLAATSLSCAVWRHTRAR